MGVGLVAEGVAVRTGVFVGTGVLVGAGDAPAPVTETVSYSAVPLVRRLIPPLEKVLSLTLPRDVPLIEAVMVEPEKASCRVYQVVAV